MNIRVTEDIAGMTIREYLRGELGYSSAMLKKLKFTPGGITVGGEFVTVRHILAKGEILSLMSEDREEDTSPYIIPADLPLGILYEDEHVTAVNKPPAMPAHPSLGHRNDTVANALAYRYSAAPYVFRPVNRLDRDTSGVMLTANTRLASYKMYKAMRAGEIEKYYIAVLAASRVEKCGEIVSYMRRMDGSIVMREECPPDADGAKLAVTKYCVAAEMPGVCAVVASPVTGRTHQLRVQFAGIGCPIVGDTMYGSESEYIGRQSLHASVSVFPHPESGERVRVCAPLPDDIADLCRKLGASPESIAAEAEKIIESGVLKSEK